MSQPQIEWRTKTMGQVCSVISRGISPKYLDDGGVCVLNQRCIRDHQIDWSPSRRHDESAKRVPSDRFLQFGDGLINSTGTGTLGRVAQVLEPIEEPTTVDSHVTIVRPCPGLFHPQFFGYMLIDIEDQLKNSGEGCGGQTELARSMVENKFNVRFPVSLREQERIVAILDEAFQGLAAAKANAKANQEQASSLLSQELSSLIVRGEKTWTSSTLGSAVKFIDYRGRTPDKTPSGLQLITAKNVRMGYVKDEPREFVAPESYENWMTRGIPKKGDVLFTTEAPLANVAQLETSERVVFAQRIIIMQPDPKKLDSTFLKFLLLSPPIQKRIHEKGTGATATGIKASLLKTIAIAFPPSVGEQLRLSERLTEMSRDADRLAALYVQKLDALDALKQSLLHQAFSGNL